MTDHQHDQKETTLLDGRDRASFDPHTAELTHPLSAKYQADNTEPVPTVVIVDLRVAPQADKPTQGRRVAGVLLTDESGQGWHVLALGAAPVYLSTQSAAVLDQRSQAADTGLTGTDWLTALPVDTVHVTDLSREVYSFLCQVFGICRIELPPGDPRKSPFVDEIPAGEEYQPTQR